MTIFALKKLNGRYINSFDNTVWDTYRYFWGHKKGKTREEKFQRYLAKLQKYSIQTI